jgi:hypothetical protein
MLSRFATALGLAALATFAYVVHRVWGGRPEPIGVHEALAHPHLLGMTHGDRHALFVSGAAALLGAAIVGVLLTAGGVYRYDQPPFAPQCLLVTGSGASSTVCRPQPDKQQAIRQTKYLVYGAGAVVLVTLLSVPALRIRRRLA